MSQEPCRPVLARKGEPRAYGNRSAAPSGEAGKDGEDSSGPGFHLSVEDAEELSLLLRPGNEVEIRVAGP